MSNLALLSLVCFIVCWNNASARPQYSQIIPGSSSPCTFYWTRFYSRDQPTSTGDWETLNLLRNENPGAICESPVAIEAQLIDGRPATASGNDVIISPTTGLICLNNKQGKGAGVHCSDFKVRFLCLN